MTIGALYKPIERHPWRKVVGLCDPGATSVTIECACGRTFAASTYPEAERAFERHQPTFVSPNAKRRRTAVKS